MNVDAVLVHFGDPHPTRVAAERVDAAGIQSVTIVDNSGNLPRGLAGRVLAPGRNLGFGAGMNLGVQAGCSPWLLLLNPDVELAPGAIATLLAAAERDAGLAVVAPRLRHPDGQEQINGGRASGWVREVSRCLGVGPRLRRLRARARHEAYRTGALIERPWVSGAAVLVRRAAFAQVGGFDERYFLYYEDEDLCRRLRAAGWRVAVCPAADAVHQVGGSTGSYQSVHFESSRALYHRVHSGPLLRTLVGWDARRRAARLSARTTA